MFGTYRTILALLVVVTHLGKFNFGGIYAVFGFYALSGYLMTLIVNRNYGVNIRGFLAYSANRILRIYPLYWISIGISLIAIRLFGHEFSSTYHAEMYLPGGFWQIFKNFVIFMFPQEDSPRLTPPAWALTVELFYYILIGLGISRSRITTWVWLAAAIFYHCIMTVTGGNLGQIYFSIPAASLPFAAGALIFHYLETIKRTLNSLSDMQNDLLIAAIAAALMGNLLAFELSSKNLYLHFYSNTIFTVAMVAALLPAKRVLWIKKPLDQWLGELSYPIYLIHYQVGLVLAGSLSIVGLNPERPSILLFAVSIPFIFLLSALLAHLVERKVEQLRGIIKTANKSLQGTFDPSPALLPQSGSRLKRP